MRTCSQKKKKKCMFMCGAVVLVAILLAAVVVLLQAVDVFEMVVLPHMSLPSWSTAHLWERAAKEERSSVFQPQRSYGLRNALVTPTSPARRPFLVILSISSPRGSNHRQLRQAIRDTYGKTCNEMQSITIANPSEEYNLHKMIACQQVFVIGRTMDNGIDGLIIDESNRYGDIFLVDSNDTYFTIIDKQLPAFKWVADQRPQFLLKTDDDVFINVKELVTQLTTNKNLPNDLYAGSMNFGRVVREKCSRSYVSKEDYPYYYYPPFCRGFWYVIAGHLLAPIVEASTHIKRIAPVHRDLDGPHPREGS